MQTKSRQEEHLDSILGMFVIITLSLLTFLIEAI